MAEETVRDELRSLRRGRGLTLAALAKCPALLEMFGSPEVAQASITRALDRLGDDMQAQALKNAYGVGLTSVGLLTQRRNDYAVEVQRHVDTVEAYENAMIEELLPLLNETPAKLLTDVFLFVTDGVVSQLRMNHVGWHLRKERDFGLFEVPANHTLSLSVRFDGELPKMATLRTYLSLLHLFAGDVLISRPFRIRPRTTTFGDIGVVQYQSQPADVPYIFELTWGSGG